MVKVFLSKLGRLWRRISRAVTGRAENIKSGFLSGINSAGERIKGLVVRKKETGEEIKERTEKLKRKPVETEIGRIFKDYEESQIKPKFRLAVIGLGNDLKGDDGVGWFVAGELEKKFGKNPDILLIKTSTPENHVKEVRDFVPNMLLIVDAASFKGKPGEVRIIDEREIQRVFYSTHRTPLTVFLELLDKESPISRTRIIGIQKKSTRFGEPMSPEVRRAGEKLADLIYRLYNIESLETGLERGIEYISISRWLLPFRKFYDAA